MQGIQIIYVKEPAEKVTVEEHTDGSKSMSQPVHVTSSVDGKNHYSPVLGGMAPRVFFGGVPVDALTKLEVKSTSDLLRPVVLMERILYSEDDVILTLTPEEFARWNIEREYRLFVDFVGNLPLKLRELKVVEEVVSPEVTLVDFTCLGRGMRIAKGLYEELSKKYPISKEPLFWEEIHS